MKICIIAEGSYPYMVGGVSSWIHMLINAMPEHQFLIYTIGAQEKDRGKFKYELPDNVCEIKEIFLDVFLNEKGILGKRYKLDNNVKMALESLISGQELDWNHIFNFFSGSKFDNVSNFLMSKEFFNILQKVYKERYSQTSFTEMFWTIRSMVLPLLYIIKQGIPEADLYHSVSTGYAGVLGSLGKYLYNKPFVLTEHGIYTREREEEIIKSDWIKIYFKDAWIEYFYSLSQCSYEKADRVVTLFNRNREIQIELGCQKEKIEIIPNGIKIEDDRNLKQKENDLLINVGAIVRVVPIKDIKTMLQAFALVKEKVPHAYFYIMGPIDEDPDYYMECMQYLDSLELKDVVFTGNINVNDYLGQMDVLVLSSISEGQPLAVLEGMVNSIPYVTTDVGSCRELLYGNNDHYGQGGIVVHVMDYQELATAITKLCKDSNLRKKMGSNSRLRVSELYTFDKFINAYKKLYAELGGQ